MSITNGVWHDAKLDPPKADEMHKTVLIVKQNKNGEKVITFGNFSGTVLHPGSMTWEGTWSTNNGKGEVLYWMPLPKIPGEED